MSDTELMKLDGILSPFRAALKARADADTLEAREWEADAAILAVQSDADCMAAAEHLKRLKGRAKTVAETYEPVCKAAFSFHRACTGIKSDVLKPYDAAETRLKGMIVQYTRERAARLAKESAERDAELRRAEEDRRLAEAAILESNGLAAAADAVLSAPIDVPQMVVEPAKTPGVYTRTTWHAKVVDFDLVPREYMLVNQSALDGLARATKGAVSVPGVRFVAVEVPAVRAEC